MTRYKISFARTRTEGSGYLSFIHRFPACLVKFHIMSYVIVVSSFLRHGIISIPFSSVAKDELGLLSKFKLRIKRKGW